MSFSWPPAIFDELAKNECKPVPVRALRPKLRWVLIATLVTLTSCDPGQSTNQEGLTEIETSAEPVNSDSAANRESIALEQALETPLRQLSTNYIEAVSDQLMRGESTFLALRNFIQRLIQSPDERNLTESRAAWQDAHQAFEALTLPMHFLSQFISEEDQNLLYQFQYQLDSWPILPGYIDYVEGYPGSGIVNDMTVSIDNEQLRALNGAFDLREVSIGLHAIEFILWGENNDQVSPRPLSDFYSVTSLTAEERELGFEVSELPNNRRRNYLSAVTDILVADYQRLANTITQQYSTVDQQIMSMNATQLFSASLNSLTASLNEEFLLRSLYPLLNGNYLEGMESRFSNSSEASIATLLSGIEGMLMENTDEFGATLDSILVQRSANYADFFTLNFDSSKECLILLYSNLQNTGEDFPDQEAEFAIVECINLVTLVADYLQQSEPDQ